jgi:hypothetical protein
MSIGHFNPIPTFFHLSPFYSTSGHASTLRYNKKFSWIELNFVFLMVSVDKFRFPTSKNKNKPVIPSQRGISPRHPTKSSDKFRHSGFKELISQIFFSRRQLFISFSLAIAPITDEPFSK